MSKLIDLQTCKHLTLTDDNGRKVKYEIKTIESPDNLTCRSCGHHVMEIHSELVQQGFVDDLHVLFTHCRKCNLAQAFRYYIGFGEGQ